MARGAHAPPRHPDRARPGGRGVMWAVIRWVTVTWLRVTLVLGGFVVCWLALGTHPGWFWLICCGALDAERRWARSGSSGCTIGGRRRAAIVARPPRTPCPTRRPTRVATVR